MSLNEILDKFGFQGKPGSTKGRMYSSRFYHAELRQVLEQELLDIVGEDEDLKEYPAYDDDYKMALHDNEIKQELRKAIKEWTNG